MESPDTPNRWWQAPLWVQIGAPVVSSLLVIAIAGAFSDLDVGEVVLYIGVPVVLVTAVVTCVLVARAAIRTARDLQAWQRNAGVLIADLGARVRRLHLSDVIHAAQVRGWTVSDNDDALVFVSPDDDEMTVYGLAPEPEKVAKDLEDLAPMHFEAKSIPFIADVGGDAGVGRAIAERLEQETLPELRLLLVQKYARAALADLEAEARANGWHVHWGADSVYFERRNDRATAAFDNIDIGRLRKALGLKWIKV